MRAALLLLALTCCTSSSATDAEVPFDAGATDAQPSRDAAAAIDATIDAAIDAAVIDAAAPADAEVADAAAEDAMADAGTMQSAMLVLVGTGDWGASNGSIISHRFDPATSELTRTATIAAGDLASFLAFDAERGVVHVADEGGGRILSFSVADDDGRLVLLDQRAASGNPVYVTLSAARRHLLAAHYNQGLTEVFGLQPNGAVADAVDLETSGGQSHSVRLSAGDRFALVPAKAADWIAQYVFDDGELTENAPPRVQTAPGAGPRHLDFHPDGAHAYVINELDNTVDAYAYDASVGTLSHLMSISALPAGFTGDSTGADIHVHPNGRFLYASERVAGGPGLIAIFSIDANGMLALLGHEETRGETPRNFTLTPGGGHLLAANQSSSSLAIFGIDEATGLLQYVRSVNLGASPFFVGVLSR
jgi:6-phosphogluconolactonase